MSDKIKPSEVSQVLLDQLKGITNAEKVWPVSTDCATPRPTNCWSLKTGRWLS